MHIIFTLKAIAGSAENSAEIAGAEGRPGELKCILWELRRRHLKATNDVCGGFNDLYRVFHAGVFEYFPCHFEKIRQQHGLRLADVAK